MQNIYKMSILEQKWRGANDMLNMNVVFIQHVAKAHYGGPTLLFFAYSLSSSPLKAKKRLVS